MSHVGQNSLTPLGEQKSLTQPKENNNLDFQLAREQVMHLETMANLCASQRQASISFRCLFYFLVGRYITKQFMTGPMGNSEFPCFCSPCFCLW